MPASPVTQPSHQAYSALDPMIARYDEATEGLYAPGADANPAAVATEISRILALPAGSRPYRSVVDFTQSHVDDVNAVNEKEADDFVTRMGFGELLTLKR